MSQTHRHVVLISGSMPDSKSVAAIMSAMRLTGAIPMLIADHAERLAGVTDTDAMRALVQADLLKADGVLVMGNDLDIDPADYGQTTRHPQTRSERATPTGSRRADYEYRLIEETIRQKKPCLCVCGGMQRLNVLLKGTLHQHVPDLVGTHYHQQGAMGIAPFIPVQYVKVVPKTKLADISKEIGGLFTPQHEKLPPGVFMENSFHHQAVGRVGEGLIACAYSIEPEHPDLHIVQAIEADPKGPYKGQFLLGVQWHPEYGASDVSARSLQNFNDEALAYARAHPKEMKPEEALAVTAKSMEKKKWKLYRTIESIDWTKTITSGIAQTLKKPPRDRGR